MIFEGRPVLANFGVLGDLYITPLGHITMNGDMELLGAKVFIANLIGQAEVNVLSLLQKDEKDELLESLQKARDDMNEARKLLDHDRAHEEWRDSNL